MSKHLGNVLEPLPLMEQHGADALRWFFAASGSPWSTRRVGHAALEEIVRKILLTYWNTVSFLALYANAAAADGNAWGPERLGEAPAPASRPVLDRWVLSELHTLVRDVTAALEGFDTASAGRRIAAFTDDLSNWYVRRSRRRFWEGPRTAESSSAFATLYECLETVTRLMAPITPFLTDYVWSALRTAGAPESVHLASWPAADAALDRRGPVRGHGADAPAGRTGAFGAGRGHGEDPPATGPGPDQCGRGSRRCPPNCGRRSPRN